MRTLAAILVIALPAGWVAAAATGPGTDAKTAPKSTAKKATTAKTTAAPFSAKVGGSKTNAKSTTSKLAPTTGKSSPAASKTGPAPSTKAGSTAAGKTGASAANSTATAKSGGTGNKTTASNSKAASSKQQASTRYRRSGQLIPSTDRYKEIQEALIDKGYFAGPADGAWGPSSVEALKRFQHDQSLQEDGKLGSLSIIALGLGPKRGGATALASPSRPSEPLPERDETPGQPVGDPGPAEIK